LAAMRPKTVDQLRGCFAMIGALAFDHGDGTGKSPPIMMVKYLVSQRLCFHLRFQYLRVRCVMP